EHLAELPPPDSAAVDDVAVDQVLESLRTRGALFVSDVAQHTGLAPGSVRAALWDLVRRGIVSNDRFDVVRRGAAASGPPVQRNPQTARSLTRSRLRPPATPEGRWFLVPWGQPETASHALLCASLLLRRYGVVARELAIMDPWMLPWRVLYEVLSRMEMTGEVRRGYFVEGLSGAQFALPEAARLLQQVALPTTANAPAILVHSLDPANLYGSGAPFDI